MDFEFSEEQELLRESVRRFLEEQAPISAYVRDRFEAECGTSDEVWKGLVEMGLAGLLVAEELGGSGMGMLEMGVVLEEMGRLVHPGPYLASSLGAVSLLQAAASPEEQASWLPALADGSRVASVALYEPTRRYEWREPETLAVDAGGGLWRVSGSKVQVAEPASADFFLVLARANEELGLFAVERAATGLQLEASETVDGTRKQGRLVLRDTAARRLGQELAAGDMAEAVERALDRLVVGTVVDGVGAAERALELSCEYARERVQFDRPIGAFQAVQHLLAEMLQDLELARAGAYYALWAAEVAGAGERRRATAVAKAFASDALPRIGANAIQIFGGVGFTWEYDIHFYYKRLLSLQHAYGGESEHLETLASMLLDAQD